MSTPTVAHMDRIIHEFMNGQWTLMANEPSGNRSVINFRSKEYDECAKLKKAELKGTKYKIVPVLKDYRFHYKSDWEALMPVARRIAGLVLNHDWKNVKTALRKWKWICRNLEVPHRRRAYQYCFEFIHWYNLQKKKK